MASPFRDYFIGLCLVLAAAGGYQITVASWLQPPVVEHAPIAHRPLSDHDESLVDLYPEDAWQRGRSIRLKTQDGMLLFQNWEQNKTDGRDSGKKWRLWPITMVIGRGLDADGAEQPILIEASEGAVIEFSAPLDVMSGVAPTIQRGQLLGAVHIRRVPPKPTTSQLTASKGSDNISAYQVRRSAANRDDDQTLDIRTANVGIDRRKIWTTEAIEMQVGQAVMIGRDLTLHLAASTGAPNSSSNLARSLDRMELIYLRELTLPLGDSKDPGAADAAQSDDASDQGVVQIHCDGRIEYDFAMDQLLMNRNVRLVHQSPRADVDQFECQTLRLTLRDPLNSDRIRTTALDWIDRIEASGMPARLSMQTQQFELTAGQILFDPLEGWLIAEPGRQGAPANPTGTSASSAPSPSLARGADEEVTLRHGEMRAALPRIVYRFDPKQPMQLGSVEIEGTGHVDYDAPDSVLESFSWRDSLKVAPLEVATADDLDVRFGVWCDGDIHADLADGGSFQTDRIEGVLRPVSDPSSSSDGTLDQRWFPDRFSAIGNVEVRSPQLHASTPLMNLFFAQVDKNSSTSMAKSEREEPASPLRQWVSQPEGNTRADSQKSQTDPPKRPATIRGEQVTAKLTFGGGDLSATDLSVAGNVEVTHAMAMRQSQPDVNSLPTPAGQQPTETMLAVMTGDHLRLRHGEAGGDVLQLGSESKLPARLELGDGYFVGPEIQVRPDDNYIWIPSAGEFVVPSAFLPSLGSGLGAGRSAGNPSMPMRWTQSPRGQFGGSMTFDGRVAKLTGGVLLETAIVQDRQPTELQMRGDELAFLLETSVDLRSPSSFRATKLSQISLKQTTNQPVEILAERFAVDGSRQSRHEMLISELTWIPSETPEQVKTSSGHHPDPLTTSLSGHVVAPGSGSYRGWIRTPVKQPETSEKPDAASEMKVDPAEDASVYIEGLIEDERATRPGKRPTPGETEITGVHLIYQGGMRGDLLGRSLTFQRGVRIGRKIVPDFDTRFDASSMNQLSQDELTLDCDQIRLSIDPSLAARRSRFSAKTEPSHADSPLADSGLEVEASGGVVFRSRTDRGLSEATAERCGYAVSKDLVKIEGIPTRPARFRQTDLTGQPVANLAIISLTLRLKPFEVLDSQVKSVSTGAVPAMKPPRR